MNGGSDDARGEKCDRWSVEQGTIPCIIVVERHKKWVAALTYLTLRPSLPHIEISNADSPRETSIAHHAPKTHGYNTTVHGASGYISFNVSKLRSSSVKDNVTKRS